MYFPVQAPVTGVCSKADAADVFWSVLSSKIDVFGYFMQRFVFETDGGSIKAIELSLATSLYQLLQLRSQWINQFIASTYIYTQSDSAPSQTNANTTNVNGCTRRRHIDGMWNVNISPTAERWEGNSSSIEYRRSTLNTATRFSPWNATSSCPVRSV